MDRNFKETLALAKELIAQIENIGGQKNIPYETAIEIARDEFASYKERFNKIEPKRYRSFTKKILTRRLQELMSLKTDSLVLINIEPLKYAIKAYEKVYEN